jgi:hypothetical protein
MKESVPELLREKQNRLFFLKAILLGIQYGESDKRIIHKQMVQQEISKMELENPNISSIPISPSSLLPPPPMISPDQSLQQKTALSIQQYEQILHGLYVKRVNLQSQIGNVSAGAYSKTMTLQQNKLSIQQIQALRALLAITLKEIEKYTLLLNSVKKIHENPKISSQETIMKKNQVKQFVEPPKLQQMNISSYQKPISVSEPKIELEEEDEDLYTKTDTTEDTQDFMKELQKTFGSLSSLLSNH